MGNCLLVSSAVALAAGRIEDSAALIARVLKCAQVPHTFFGTSSISALCALDIACYVVAVTHSSAAC
jgi:hypothetical protein